MKFIIDLSVEPGTSPATVADCLMDILTDVEYAPYVSCDNVEPYEGDQAES